MLQCKMTRLYADGLKNRYDWRWLMVAPCQPCVVNNINNDNQQSSILERHMKKSWALVTLIFLSVPAFAANNGAADTANTCATKTEKTTPTNSRGENDSDATTACVANSKETPATGRSRTQKNTSPRWHSMLPGMFR
jgi:hypothetical protein